MSLNKGYWRDSPHTKDIRECPNRKACAGGNGSAVWQHGAQDPFNYCTNHHWGPMCALCTKVRRMFPRDRVIA